MRTGGQKQLRKKKQNKERNKTEYVNSSSCLLTETLFVGFHGISTWQVT